MKEIEVEYIEPRRYCRGCRRKRTSFPEAKAESYCTDCTASNLFNVLEAIRTGTADGSL